VLNSFFNVDTLPSFTHQESGKGKQDARKQKGDGEAGVA
jgi:hypothetical protein